MSTATRLNTMANPQTDLLLSINIPTANYMHQIVIREKDHEFRKYRYPSTVARIWFYENAPVSAVTYICDVDQARTRTASDKPLETTGVGNAEFNAFHPDFQKYEFAYRIRSCRRLKTPIPLDVLQSRYGFEKAPRGVLFATEQMIKDHPVEEQPLLWSDGAE